MGCPDRASGKLDYGSCVGKSERHWGLPIAGDKEDRYFLVRFILLNGGYTCVLGCGGKASGEKQRLNFLLL